MRGMCDRHRRKRSWRGKRKWRKERMREGYMDGMRD